MAPVSPASPPSPPSPTSPDPSQRDAIPAGAPARPLRLLHTSDWHLGASLGNASREPEQARMLDWLADVVETRQVDAVVVAGDVFDHAQPSAEALRLYYGLLRRLARVPTLRKVVVVAGNHDSPSRMDAPREVLDALDVHVVGGLRRDEESWERCLCPIEDDHGDVLGVVAAVPFVHEFRLGVRTTAGDAASVRARFQEAVAHLYRFLAARAQARWPDAPLVATGHLTCVGARREDYHQPIHRFGRVDQVGTLDNLPAEVFDPAYDYVALGHIHRAFPVCARGPGELGHRDAEPGAEETNRVWYSGAPLAYNFGDVAVPRQVLLVEVGRRGSHMQDETGDGGDGASRAGSVVHVERVPVPTWRRLVPITGTVDEVEAALREVRWDRDAELAPLVGVTAEVDSYVPGLASRLHQVLGEAAGAMSPAAGAAPVLVEVVQRRRDVQEAAGLAEETPRLRDMQPEEVFERLCQAQGVSLDDALLGAFRQLAAEQDQGLEPGAGLAEDERSGGTPVAAEEVSR